MNDAVIPYAVGVDIACRMMLTVTDMPLGRLHRHRNELIRVLESETLFGSGAAFQKPDGGGVANESRQAALAVASNPWPLLQNNFALSALITLSCRKNKELEA